MSSVACALATMLLLPALIPTSSRAAPGDLDLSFGTAGVVTVTVAPSLHEIGDVALSSDGRIVVAGRVYISGEAQWLLTRHLADGGLDPSFGMGGIVTLDVAAPRSSGANGVYVRPDGVMLVGGFATTMGIVTSDLALARVLADGTLDATFGIGGVARVAGQGGLTSAIGRPLELPDGRIVVAGGSSVAAGYWRLLLARFDSTGTLDPTFGSGGLVVLDAFPTHDLFLAGPLRLPDGRLVAAGYGGLGGDHILVARFEADGAVSTGFGAAGMVVGPAGAATDVALVPGGKVVVGGRGEDPARFFLARYSADGTPDATFGEDGGMTEKPTGHAVTMAPTPDGRFYFLGGDGIAHAIVVRYTAEGVRDSTFGPVGQVQVSLPSGAGLSVAETQPDGRLVVGGQIDGPVRGIFLTRFLGDLCGDGIVDDGERCDDGNLAAGDGCSPSCTIEACHTCAGEPSVCAVGPRPVCRTSTLPAKSPLRLEPGTSSAARRLVWWWRGGQATSFTDFSEPREVDGYVLCLFDTTGAQVARASIPAGGLCRTKSCWRATRTNYVYSDADRTPDGIHRLKLAAGSEGRVQVKVSGKGSLLGLPALPLALPVTAQLHREDGQCWGATYTAATVTRNDQTSFRGVATY